MKSLYPLLLFLVLSHCLLAQFTPKALQIPMRDGKTLAADLYSPDTTQALPVIFIQTPYSKLGFNLLGLPLGVDKEIENSDYAFVVMDLRGFFASIPAFVLGSNDGEDGYDAIEWIAQQPWCNGKIGTWGPSALGGIQYRTAQQQPPSLICAMPMVATPLIRYDNYYPGGSIRVESLQTLDLLFGGGASTDLIVNNPYYNLLWQSIEFLTNAPQNIEVPMLLIGGWYDQNTERMFTWMDALGQSSAPAVRDQHKFLIGPWVHGGAGDGDLGSLKQGELMYPGAVSYDDSLGKLFFDFYLRGIQNSWDTLSSYVYFQMGDNTWRYADSWPPQAIREQTWYLHPDQSMQTSAPTQASGKLSFAYDPTDPSPTIGGKTLNFSLSQGPADQVDSVESRHDNLIFTTPALTEDVVVKGNIQVNLSVSSDRKDTDVAVRLTEVYPDGRSMLLSAGIQRMRFRNGFRVGDTASMVPETVYPITIELEKMANTFKTGHRIRLIITGANYPRFNRNMNTGGEMYPNGNLDTLVNPLVATNSIEVNNVHVSSIVLPTVQQTATANGWNPASFELTLYPNPSSGWVHLQSSTMIHAVKIYDLAGQLVKALTVTPANQLRLDLQALPVGAYYIQAYDKTGAFVTHSWMKST